MVLLPAERVLFLRIEMLGLPRRYREQRYLSQRLTTTYISEKGLVYMY